MNRSYCVDLILSLELDLLQDALKQVIWGLRKSFKLVVADKKAKTQLIFYFNTMFGIITFLVAVIAFDLGNMSFIGSIELFSLLNFFDQSNIGSGGILTYSGDSLFLFLFFSMCLPFSSSLNVFYLVN